MRRRPRCGCPDFSMMWRGCRQTNSQGCNLICFIFLEGESEQFKDHSGAQSRGGAMLEAKELLLEALKEIVAPLHLDRDRLALG